MQQLRVFLHGLALVVIDWVSDPGSDPRYSPGWNKEGVFVNRASVESMHRYAFTFSAKPEAPSLQDFRNHFHKPEKYSLWRSAARSGAEHFRG